MFANPVPGYIHPMDWVRPTGNIEMKINRGCKEHVAAGVGCALDIGNKQTGAPVYSMAAGKVTSRYIQNTPGLIGHGALIIRVTHADGWSTGYAHLQAFSVALGAIVTRGQQIGVLGATGYGITGPHLHTDAKLNNVAQDLWPLLDQNGADMIQGTWVSHISNKKATAVAGARFRDKPTLTSTVLATLPAGAIVLPVASVNSVAVNGSTLWYAAIMDTADANSTPDTLGYLHSSTLSALSPIESFGYTQAQVDAAVAKAKADATAANEAKWESWVTTHP